MIMQWYETAQDYVTFRVKLGMLFLCYIVLIMIVKPGRLTDDHGFLDKLIK